VRRARVVIDGEPDPKTGLVFHFDDLAAAISEARDALAPFAELEKSPEHIHTYRITRLGLWNARAAGHTAEDVDGLLNALRELAEP